MKAFHCAAPGISFPFLEWGSKSAATNLSVLLQSKRVDDCPKRGAGGGRRSVRNVEPFTDRFYAQ